MRLVVLQFDYQSKSSKSVKNIIVMGFDGCNLTPLCLMNCLCKIDLVCSIFPFTQPLSFPLDTSYLIDGNGKISTFKVTQYKVEKKEDKSRVIMLHIIILHNK